MPRRRAIPEVRATSIPRFLVRVHPLLAGAIPYVVALAESLGATPSSPLP